MKEVIESIVNHPEATLLVLGLFLAIGAITKGGLDLGFIKLPELETGQAKLLGILGGICIIAAMVVAWKPWAQNTPPEELNTPPVASNDRVEILKGDETVIDVLKNDTDKDEDALTVTIVASPGPGFTNLSEGKKIKYKSDPERSGTFTITYEVSDGKGGKDTAQAIIVVKAPPPKIVEVEIQGKLIDVFGQPKSGIYKFGLDNQEIIDSITANTKGLFKLTTRQGYSLCNLFIEDKLMPFDLDPPGEIKTVEYDPIDTLIFTFCKDYEKAPIDIFPDRDRIPFQELKVDTVKTKDGGILKYGILHCGLKFFGSASNEYSSRDKNRELYFQFIQKNRDAIIYDPIPINSGTSSNGWDSYLNKKLLRGEYELHVLSKSGKLLRFIEFKII